MTDFLATFPVFLVFALVASRYIRRFPASDRLLLWVSFVAHQAAAIANIVIVHYHYKYGDMMTYHRLGTFAADRLRADFMSLAPGLIKVIFQRGEPLPIPELTPTGSTGSMQGASAFAMFFLGDSLYATCAFIAGLAFLSKLALYVVALAELEHVSRRALLWACMLVPSAVFWSSSLLKEPIAMIGLLFGTYACHQLIVRKNWLRAGVIFLLASPLIVFFLGYLLPVLAVSAGSWYIVRAVRDNRGDVVVKTGHLFLAGAVAVIVVFATGELLPRFSLDNLDTELARMQVASGAQEGGSNYTLGDESGEAAGQARLAPLALFTALFRPLLFEVKNPLMLTNALETTAFLACAAFAPFKRGPLVAFAELFRRPFLAFCVVFVVVFGTCAGLGSTNLGTLSRYRAPLVPFLAVGLVALIARRQRVAAEPAPGASQPAPSDVRAARQPLHSSVSAANSAVQSFRVIN